MILYTFAEVMKMPRRKGDAKASYKLAQILEPGFELPSDRTELLKVYRTVAKAADQRLVRLEKVTQEENFKVADKWAYARAMRDIQAWSGEDAKRFNVTPPGSKQGIAAKIEDIKTFLQAPTSTKTGIKKTFIDKANTINKEYGTSFKWDQVGKFFTSENWKKIADKYGSRTALKAIGKTKKFDKAKLEKAVKAADTSDLRVPDDQVGKVIKDIVKDKGDDLLKLLNL